MKKLFRNREKKMIGGVASGLADYLDLDVTLVRVILVAGIFLPFPVIIPYLIMWAIMPENKAYQVVSVQ
jgi:phage shock protein C